MATPSPYSRPGPIRRRCVANRTPCKAATFKSKEGKIKSMSFTIKTTSALSDRTNIYLSSTFGDELNLEEGATYYLKNVTVSNKYGRQNIHFGKSSSKFRTAPIELAAKVEKAAREALCPQSQKVTGNEGDIFSRGDYLSLQGRVLKVS
ncbi:hypothetical protein DPX16_0246 [Anabarilius grahami]|uniref:Uncharacterized protein n=1 Tax=Anabarilius grahami TaxID=495550 RepID=A0A3N0XEQ1_ANAGA|nr:hypothetical protein DPX16_0246 [Anabarilius grahami]